MAPPLSLGFGLGLPFGGAPSVTDPSIIAPAALMDWFRPDPGFEVDNGSVLTTLTNRSAAVGRENLARVVGSAPAFTPSDAAFSGRPTFTPAVTGSKNIIGATASLYNYLHSGSPGCTVLTVVMPTNTASNLFLWGTIAGSGANVGAFMSFASVNTLRWAIGNGTQVVIQCDDTDGAFTVGQPHVILGTYSPAAGGNLYVDGVLRKTVAQSNAPVGTVATNPLGLAGNGAGNFEIDCRIAEWVGWAQDYSTQPAVIAALFAYAKARYFASVALATVDFSGDAAGLAATQRGLTLTRGTSRSVRTSATTVSTSLFDPSLGIGFDGVHQGAVVEEGRTNKARDSRDLTTVWSGAGVATAGFANGPDGAVGTASHLVTTSGLSGKAQTGLAATSGAWETGSGWVMQGASSSPSDLWVGGVGAHFATFTPNGTWQYVTVSDNDAAGTRSIAVSDGQNNAPLGGPGAAAHDDAWDMLQLEDGHFPTEYIFTVSAAIARLGERLVAPNGAWLVGASGRVSFEFRVYMKGASTEYSANMRLFTVDATNYAEIDATTHVMRVVQGGVAYATPVAMTWARGDLVEISVEAGGGGAATRVEYRVNGGTATKLSTGTPPVQGVFAPAGSMDILHGSGTNQLSCWFQRLKSYPDGQFASWVI